VIYKSTLQQASSYMDILDRINSVGMAVQIVDSISGTADNLKNETRAELVKLLLSPGPHIKSISHPATKRVAREQKDLRNEEGR
jgi:hypothetical protein